MELIQNAEDNEYSPEVNPSLEFVITSKDITGVGAPATLLVFNNEIGFLKRNVESICSVGRSTKRGRREQGFIGEKGIGFKSIFLVSKRPYIFSNGYQIRFSDDPDPTCGIGYVVPEWVDAGKMIYDVQRVYGSHNSLPTTIIALPLRSEKVRAVKQQLSEVHPELLLFLNKIKQLTVHENNVDSQATQTVSAISIFSETDLVTMKDRNAESRTVHLLAEEGNDGQGEECRYYIWRQTFPVRAENKVDGRREVKDLLISLAFPFGERLKRGASSTGIYAFLLTTMVTNFPFIIQADFILASSRETILLDNKWNLGILDCIPSAFVAAFVSCVRSVKTAPLSSVAQMFNFLPAEASNFAVLNAVREDITSMLQDEFVIPCETSSDAERVFCKPSGVMRLLSGFRKILSCAKEEGISLEGLPSSNMYVLHPSLDLRCYNTVLEYIGVGYVYYDNYWYGNCIQGCDIALEASEDLYIELLGLVAHNWKNFKISKLYRIPLLRYVDGKGSVSLLSTNDVKYGYNLLFYSLEPQLHAWLNNWNVEFGLTDTCHFFPNATQMDLTRQRRKTFLYEWLHYNVGVTCVTVFDYLRRLVQFVGEDLKLVISLAHFLYQSHLYEFIEDKVFDVCISIPIVDGNSEVHVGKALTLVPSSGSRWKKLMASNPFTKCNYIDLGDVYAESVQFAGLTTPKDELLCFLKKYTNAVDLPEIPIPDVDFPVASSPLTAEQAFLLLGWIPGVNVF